MALRKLSTYRKKRDFEKTAEPSGDTPVKPSKRRRFVIQKHAATRLHYDLRLEFDGVFKSWAVTNGPSLDPHDKRLAVEVEDHPLDYGDFEGTIPRGEYGGGTVQLWDRGYWESDDPGKGFKKGDLKFTLHGDKLHGSWVLVRMRHDRDGGKRTNWLLIKHRDEYAREGKANDILDEDQSVASGRTMDQIADGKGRAPKPFMTAKSARGKADAVWHSNRGDDVIRVAAPPKELKAKKVATMPDFVAPAALHLGRSPAHPERDGATRSNSTAIACNCASRTARPGSRPARAWTGPTSSRRSRKRAARCRMCSSTARSSRSTTMARRIFPRCRPRFPTARPTSSIFYAFDLLFAGGEDLRRLPLGERKARLKKLLEARPRAKTRSIRYVEHFESGGDAILESARKLSLEGIVSKKLECALSLRPVRELDQGQMPRRTRGRARRLEDHQRQIPLADGRRLSRRSSGLCRDGRHRLRAGQGQAHHAGAEGGELRTRVRSAARMRRARPATCIG